MTNRDPGRASGVPPVTVLSASPSWRTIELLRKGVVSGRVPSSSTGPRKVSEKIHASEPSRSGTEYVLSAPVQPTPESAFGRTRRTTDPSGAELSFVALSEDLDEDTRTRRTQVRYERRAPGAPTETIEREWVIHWQTPSTIATLAEAAGLCLLHLDPAGIGRDTALRPGAEFTAYLGHADRVPARRA